MLRFVAYAVPLLLLQLALFGFAVELLDAEPRSGSVIRLALLEQPLVPGKLVLGTWLVEASGLIALFLLAQGRFGRWWLDGLMAGWVAWIFRGPLLVITIVVAARQPQDPWWTLAFGWWVLYSACGLSLAILARRSRLEPWTTARDGAAAPEVEPPEVVPPEVVPPEMQPPEMQPPEVQPPEVQPPEVQPPEVEPPEAEPPEIQPPEIQPPEIQPPEIQPPEIRPPEIRPPAPAGTQEALPVEPEEDPATVPTDVERA